MSLKKHQRYGWVAASLAILGLAALAIPAGLYLYKLGSLEFSNLSGSWADLGTYFGGVTGPVVALLALLALALNLYLQAVELDETRAEASRQRDGFDRQMFEGTLFQLVAQFHEVTKAIHATEGPKLYRGREAITQIVAALRGGYKPSKLYPPSDPRADAAVVQDLYKKLYDAAEQELGPYFRSLFHIFKHIEQSARSEEEKADYASVVRAQLSRDELFLLFYNGTWREGREFRPLIEKYGILKHVSRVNLLRPAHIDNRDWYAVSAFQSYDDRKAGALKPSSVNAREEAP